MSERGGMRAWRLVKRAYAETAFDGEGSFRFGGRWNTRGVRMVYVSSSLSLAALEFLVHLDTASAVPAMVAIPVWMPGDLVEGLSSFGEGEGPQPLPNLAVTRAVGDRWVREARSAVLAVPSAVVPHEFNLLLNLAHPDYSKLRIGEAEPFAYDERLLR